MFEIKCLKCGESALFKEGVNDESQIKISGEVEAPCYAHVYLECKCGNKITIEKD